MKRRSRMRRERSRGKRRRMRRRSVDIQREFMVISTPLTLLIEALQTSYDLLPLL
jgi:hypothetical protein